MSELDDRLIEGRATVATMDPPEDLWARALERANNGDVAVLDLPAARYRRRASVWLAVAAVTVLIALVGALALLDDHQTLDTTPATDVPAVTDPRTNDDGPTTLARADDVTVGGVMQLGGKTLNIDAVQQNGEVTGEFRVNNLVVTLQCADVNGVGDLILGGEVTADPDGQSFALPPQAIGFDEIDVAVGDLFALIIRDNGPVGDRVSVYANDSAGSCSELADAAAQRPTDGGFFEYAGGDIETEPFSTTLAKGEDVEIGGFGYLAGQTLNIDAESEDSEVTGEFRVNNVAVTLQCADTDTIDGEIRLGGEVTHDPDGQGLPTLDGVKVAVGDLVALIIRERGPDFDQVSLYANASVESCTELVESVPYNLDGGFFNEVEDGDAIETGQVEFNP